MNPSDYKDLGYANDWKAFYPTGQPPEVDACEAQDHKLVVVKIGNCLNEYICKICKIKYAIDSSG